MSDELTNNAFFTAKPGLSETLGARLLALLAPTRQEPGCTQYEIFRSADHPDASFVYEDWRSQADFQAHMGTAYTEGGRKQNDGFGATGANS
jgi:quinol monooxygenase YgiN